MADEQNPQPAAEAPTVPPLNEGEVAVEILDSSFTKLERHVLTASLNCCRSLSRMDGGLLPLAQKVASLDMDTIMTVLYLGLGYYGTRRPPKDLEERIYRTGFVKFTTPCSTLITYVANGGKAPKDTTGESAEASQDNQNPPQTT